MNEPISPRQPFESQAAEVRGGCGKAALIGCGSVFLLLLVAGIVFMVKAKEITAWGFGMMETQVMARLPAEASDEDARRIRQGFEELTRAVQEDRVDPLALEQLQPVILRFADPNKSPDSSDIERLIELLESAAGVTGREEPATGLSEPSLPEPTPQTSG